jgi:Fe2+ or Zn2+ uptake regulation protein
MATITEPQLIERLRERGQRVTPQRLVLHRVLVELDRHVAAEEVLRAAEPRLPNLSLPTVYATLDLLEQLGAVRRLVTPGGAALYDPRAEDHHHLACRRCGDVVDVDAPLEAGPLLRAARATGARPEGVQVVLSGLCADCAATDG